jgi:hypothetical protein
MLRDSLTTLIGQHYGEVSKMDDNKLSEVFLELHKELVFIFHRDFTISDPIIDVEPINLIDADKGANKTG